MSAATARAPAVAVTGAPRTVAAAA